MPQTKDRHREYMAEYRRRKKAGPPPWTEKVPEPAKLAQNVIAGLSQQQRDTILGRINGRKP